MATTPTRKIVIFSGGSAANSLVDVFNEVIDNNSCTLSYVIPISDNGGSSSELIRVFGGPGIGDIRSMTFPDSTSSSCFYSCPRLWSQLSGSCLFLQFCSCSSETRAYYTVIPPHFIDHFPFQGYLTSF